MRTRSLFLSVVWNMLLRIQEQHGSRHLASGKSFANCKWLLIHQWCCEGFDRIIHPLVLVFCKSWFRHAVFRSSIRFLNFFRIQSQMVPVTQMSIRDWRAVALEIVKRIHGRNGRELRVIYGYGVWGLLKLFLGLMNVMTSECFRDGWWFGLVRCNGAMVMMLRGIYPSFWMTIIMIFINFLRWMGLKT